MVISAAKNIRKKTLQFYIRNDAFQPNEGIHFVSRHHYHRYQNQQQCRFLHTQLATKPCDSKLSSRFHFLHVRSSYSTSSSSSSTSAAKIGFLKWYLGMLETRPFITKSISSSLIYTAADITSQMITLPPSGSLDTVRTLRIGAYGLVIMGPSQHVWFNSLSKIFPQCDVLTTLKKIIMGQVIYGPAMNSIFFSYNAALQGETKEDIVARLKRDLLPTLKNGVMYWPLCDFLTFKSVPVHLQPLANSSFAYLWTIYLTYMASLKKVGEE